MRGLTWPSLLPPSEIKPPPRLRASSLGRHILAHSGQSFHRVFEGKSEEAGRDFLALRGLNVNFPACGAFSALWWVAGGRAGKQFPPRMTDPFCHKEGLRKVRGSQFLFRRGDGGQSQCQPEARRPNTPSVGSRLEIASKPAAAQPEGISGLIVSSAITFFPTQTTTGLRLQRESPAYLCDVPDGASRSISSQTWP
ncbi:hypothetical protein AAFF_G00107040 [Aldrovandia affinis]|uniref:Uncharacterized protein n=1 Tax=Aldrovandia affinis TaxID=143900 RepID=A0AAD7T3I2_9TELE|nr:hypothetical protein AAFF_G00107040 [Aldrovandia affinis]